MAPRTSRLRYSEIYGPPRRKENAAAPAEPAAQLAAAAAPCGGSGPWRLPFGFQMARSQAQLRRRCLVLAGLLVPLLLWHAWSRSFGEVYPAAAAPPADARRLHANDTDHGITPPPGMMTGYECLTADEYQDRQEIKFMTVRKASLTMGGRDQSGCPSGSGPCLKSGSTWLLVFYLPIVFYMFVALAIVCDEFFVPSLEAFVEHYDISMDIAGATFMAAGGSMPELFTSLIAVFDESDVGMAAIVGSAVFNVLFVIAVCTLASSEALELSAWPLARDCTFYIISLALIVVFFLASSPNEIEWWEALLLFFWYLCYCGFMTVNGKVRQWVESWWTKSTKVVVPESAEKAEPPITATRNSWREAGLTGLQGDGENARKGSFTTSLRMPSKFRSGIVKLLTQHASMTETAGIAVVTEMTCTLQEAFDEMDVDGDGKIDEAEFNLFMQKLGWHPPSDDEIRDIKEDATSKLWKRMPLTTDDKLAFEDFRKWYTVSEARIEIEVRRVFERLDRNGDGILDKDEIAQLMLMLGHRPTNAELQEVMTEITQLSANEDVEDKVSPTPLHAGARRDRGMHACVTQQQFEKWYSQSLFCQSHHRKHELEKIEEEGFSIDWPEKDAKRLQLFWYVFSYPLCAAMYCTLPDIRRPGMKGRVCWAIIEFCLSLIWIGIFALTLYEYTVICSNTIGIPTAVAAVTILAAGTSVPDLLSSYIVARQGEGDMAVSSSIGSNIFDVTVGLPIPWLLYSISSGKRFVVQTTSLIFSVLVLIFMLTSVIATVMWMRWRMTRGLGAIMIILYFLFILQDLLQQLPKSNPILNVSF